ncbi:restriction endonuclease [Haloplanus aerogenes]|uniref:Restriction endonuclease n=1 Tax=Haloplanus aerogenes TaxID=660522 RepID=A0A3M0D9K0_9EURY|nr:restriction endonuclease [Haloplanus aerogenes]AZH26176.1 restriction endonuclease [Haloplanus aerogenes]RMB18371.1 restriction endonuclease [Haloplanus aerogenes]
MGPTPDDVLDDLHDIDAYDFERVVADLWRLRGWETTITTGSNDGGVDVVAEKDDPFPRKQLIQAKRYARGNNVGSPDIQQYSSLKQQFGNVDTVVVVTTSDFTERAREVAASLNVKLIAGDQLASLLLDADARDILDEYLDDPRRDEAGDAAQPDTGGGPAAPADLIDGVRRLHRHLENEGDAFANVEFEHEGVTDAHYQINMWDQHNLTGLSEAAAAAAERLADEYGHQIDVRESYPAGEIVTFSSGRAPGDVDVESVARVAVDVLSTVYGVSVADVRRIRVVDT